MSFLNAKAKYDNPTLVPLQTMGHIQRVNTPLVSEDETKKQEAGILATNTAKFENSFSFYKRFLNSKDPKEIMECIKHAKILKELIPAIVAEAENKRLEMLEALGVSHMVEPRGWSDYSTK